MTNPRHAVHRTILVADVEAFGDRNRTNAHQIAVRDGLYRALEHAFRDAEISWDDCHREDRGDGVFILAPAEQPKGQFVESLPHALVKALREHNGAHPLQERIRLRMVIHAGEVNYDDHGVTAASVNLAFRLLDAGPLKAALANSPGVLALIISEWFFDEVVRHSTAAEPDTYRPVRVMVKETSTVGWICLPDHPYLPRAPHVSAANPVTPVPRQLPVATRHFAGRVAELEHLTGLLDEGTAAGDTVVISAIEGTAGIGKTALAVRWAHQVADRFPDGQLYVNLRGFDPTGTAMSPAEAVRGFLDALEVPPERIPVSLEAQAGLYRSLLVGRRVLVLLDNARDADQIRPLLPSGPGCLVLVTSRNRLTSLIATEGAYSLDLDVLTAGEAHQLLVRRLGAERVSAEPQAVDEIIAFCANLPLALSVVAARAATHAGFPLAALAAELRDAEGRLDAFDGGDLAANVRAVFSWSYERLSAPAMKLFRQLGLHPAPDTSLPATASLAGVPLGRVRPMVAELARAHLVQEYMPGRFAFHDLLRVYAAELADTLDPEPERDAALRRVLDHYLHTAHTAALRLFPMMGPITLGPRHPGVTPEEPGTYAAARAWFDAEYLVLLAAIQLAVATGHDTHAWQLPWTLEEFFKHRGHWHDWVSTHHAALRAAQRSADRYGQAHAHRGLGRAYPWLGRFEESMSHLRQALGLFEELGDQAGQALTLTELGHWLGFQNHHEEALAHAQRALELSRAAGDIPTQCRALNNIGWYHIALGGYHEAFAHCEEGLTLSRGLGDRRTEAHTLDTLGYAHHHVGRHQEAIACYEQAMTRMRELGDRFNEAIVLTHLGDSQYAIGDLSAARATFQRALDIRSHFEHGLGTSVGYPDLDELRAKLRDLDSAAPATPSIAPARTD
jgi:tetratricopeptide (TPR) repeat protein